MSRLNLSGLVLSILFTCAETVSASPICGLWLDGVGSIVREGEHFQMNEISPSQLSRFNQIWPPFGPVKAYIAKGQSLRNELNQLLQTHLLDQADAVIYPAAGTDAIFPYVLFPNAPLVVAIDNHPFATDEHNDFQFSSRSVDSLAFRLHHDIAQERPLGSRILSNLSMVIPNFRPIKGELFGDKENSRQHALILFDRGPGTPIQMFLFVNESIASTDSGRWWHAFLGEKIAVLVKGAMHFQLRPFSQNLERQKSLKEILVVGSDFEIGHVPMSDFLRASTAKVVVGYGARESGQTLLLHKTITH